MTAILVVIGFAIFSFVVDKVKAEIQKYDQKQNEEKIVEKEQKIVRKKVNSQKEKKSKRKIIDREKEIYSNFEVVDKDKIVNDIIFAEILSKPKSKR